ncbi:hypothetical protein OG21DRAFT_1518188 [Imleria badia]|nr:hypothetical protein OG21DRAFT_1518188 [Imleria badia]
MLSSARTSRAPMNIRNESFLRGLSRRCHRLHSHNILSFDGGGGFRGLTSLVILDYIMQMLVYDQDDEPVPSPCQIFDLICGTSTAGIVAILLGRLGLDCSTAISAVWQKNHSDEESESQPPDAIEHQTADVSNSLD